MADGAVIIVDPAPAGVSFNSETKAFLIDNVPVKIYHFSDDTTMPWFQAKPIHNRLGARNIAQTLSRVSDDRKSSLQNLIETKGQPLGVVMSDITTFGYHDKKAIYVNEPGLYDILLGSTKDEAVVFRKWVTGVVLPSLRRTGTYSVPGASTTSSIDTTTTTAAALNTMVQTFGDRLVEQITTRMADNHGVLEITRSRGTSSRRQNELVSIGTKVDDTQLAVINAEGGPLHLSCFLQEQGVRHELIRRLTPTFAVEVARRKRAQFEHEGRISPLWIAWSLGAWRMYYTEADRELIMSVFEDPLTTQNIERLANNNQRPRASAPMTTAAAARRQQGPYSLPLQGSSSEATPRTIRQYFSVPPPIEM